MGYLRATMGRTSRALEKLAVDGTFLREYKGVIEIPYMIFTVAIFIIAFASIGTLVLYKKLLSRVNESNRITRLTYLATRAIEKRLIDTERSASERHNKLVDAIAHSALATADLISEQSIVAATDAAAIKVAIASVRHDLAIDAGQAEQHVDKLKEEIEEDGKKTRKDIQEVKTRLADEERDDQAAKRRARESGLSNIVQISEGTVTFTPSPGEPIKAKGVPVVTATGNTTISSGKMKDKRKRKATKKAA